MSHIKFQSLNSLPNSLPNTDVLQMPALLLRTSKALLQACPLRMNTLANGLFPS